MSEIRLAEPMSVDFDEAMLEPGELKQFVARINPRVALFRGDKLVASESKPMATNITAIKVGQKQQMASYSNPDGVKSAFFHETSLGSDILLDTWNPPLDLIIEVKNLSDFPVKWSAKLHGKGVFEMLQ